MLANGAEVDWNDVVDKMAQSGTFSRDFADIARAQGVSLGPDHWKWAAMYNNVEALEYLMEHGREGMTADIAAQIFEFTLNNPMNKRHNTEAARFLLCHGAPITDFTVRLAKTPLSLGLGPEQRREVMDLVADLERARAGNGADSRK